MIKGSMISIRGPVLIHAQYLIQPLAEDTQVLLMCMVLKQCQDQMVLKISQS